jgi:phosphoribosyl 1,2-cyclic phosphodiesterase
MEQHYGAGTLWRLGYRSAGTTRGCADVNIDFYGVRGSTPCACESNRRYGGNTACVVIEQPGASPIVLDLGTGLRMYGEALGTDAPFAGHALVTHLHWDHVQGLPFFAPLLRAGSRLDIWGPAPQGRTLRQAFDQFMGPPWFPVGVDDLPGEIEFHDLATGAAIIGDAEVQAVAVPHIGDTFGYRIGSTTGPTVAYLPDHQQPLDGSMVVAPEVIELCRNVDVLIHDAQFTPEEFAQKSDWGHCTVAYAVEVAAQAGARRLVLFHHDPAHDDAMLDQLLAEARALPAAVGIEEIIAAEEGLTLHLTAGALPSADSPVA